ncbi:putative Mg2+ transporter-C (MgtC) family protein [Pullulanibacillus pueri]|uniref:Methyltransferase n=1 Tax=Pullulanibacillus pueri TaxID=1437324 RepID=A0A8J2ZVG8_9BACL|nr:putative Mg2+ transporter-C (MgtC) family protein [Pullulanibacillus pueri]GGH81006.1 methyltransferase [Pullulanibacillus pueri]
MLLEFVLRLVLSGILGALIGLEREKRLKEAGLRTHFLVAVGSAVIMIISKYAFNDVLNDKGMVLDPSRIAAQVVSGIGFLGAGTILVQRQSIRGLTTAAGLWATSGIGLAIGAGLYTVGIVCAILILLGFEVLKLIFKPVLPNKVFHLTVYSNTHDVSNTIVDILIHSSLSVAEYQVNLKKGGKDSSQYTMQFQLKNKKKEINENKLTKDLLEIEGVTGIKFY